MYKKTSQLVVVAAAFAGLSFAGAATAAAAPAPAGAMVAVSTEADNRFQLPVQPRSSQQVAPKPNRSVYGPYISRDQVRLVAD